MGFMVDLAGAMAGGRGRRFRAVEWDGRVAPELKVRGDDEGLRGCAGFLCDLAVRLGAKWSGKDGGALRPLADALCHLKEKAVGDEASSRVSAAAAAVAYDGPVPTVRLRHKKTAEETMVKSLEPRVDEEKKYAHTKDKGKEKQVRGGEERPNIAAAAADAAAAANPGPSFARRRRP